MHSSGQLIHLGIHGTQIKINDDNDDMTDFFTLMHACRVINISRMGEELRGERLKSGERDVWAFFVHSNKFWPWYLIGFVGFHKI